MKNTCQNIKFDDINTAFKHSISAYPFYLKKSLAKEKSLIILFIKRYGESVREANIKSRK